MVGDQSSETGERSIALGDVPLRVFEQRGKPDQPLVVFLPGAIHLARISYGHGSASPEDFLAHWWKDAGHSFVALSYPLELAEPVFETVDPHLGLASYADAAASYVESVVGEWELNQRVVVLAWSAAGNIAPRLNVELARRGIDLELFVSLAATPAVPGLIFGSLERASEWAGASSSFTATGLLAHAGLRSFLPELEWTDRRYQRTVISEAEYASSYVGNMPLNLFPGLDVQRVDGGLIVGHEGPLNESRGTAWSEYPMVASLQPTWPTDARHAMTDRFNWGFVQTNMLSASKLPESVIGELSEAEWRASAELVQSVPDRLTRTIEGGHMFFVGIDGAKQTIDLVQELVRQARAIAADFDQLLR